LAPSPRRILRIDPAPARISDHQAAVADPRLKTLMLSDEKIGRLIGVGGRNKAFIEAEFNLAIRTHRRSFKLTDEEAAAEQPVQLEAQGSHDFSDKLWAKNVQRYIKSATRGGFIKWVDSIEREQRPAQETRALRAHREQVLGQGGQSLAQGREPVGCLGARGLHPGQARAGHRRGRSNHAPALRRHPPQAQGGGRRGGRRGGGQGQAGRGEVSKGW